MVDCRSTNDRGAGAPSRPCSSRDAKRQPHSQCASRNASRVARTRRGAAAARASEALPRTRVTYQKRPQVLMTLCTTRSGTEEKGRVGGHARAKKTARRIIFLDRKAKSVFDPSCHPTEHAGTFTLCAATCGLDMRWYTPPSHPLQNWVTRGATPYPLPGPVASGSDPWGE